MDDELLEPRLRRLGHLRARRLEDVETSRAHRSPQRAQRAESRAESRAAVDDDVKGAPRGLPVAAAAVPGQDARGVAIAWAG